MVSEERVKLMTKMAIFDKNEGDRCRRVAEWRRQDYLGFVGIGQFFLGTFIYAVLCVGYFFLYLKDKVFEMSWEEMEGIGFRIVIFYIIFMIIYMIATRVKASRYYERCRRKMAKYEENFNKLNQMYKREEQYTAPLEWIEK